MFDTCEVEVLLRERKGEILIYLKELKLLNILALMGLLPNSKKQ